jgi:cytochrome c oxidase assembly protein subunit 15
MFGRKQGMMTDRLHPVGVLFRESAARRSRSSPDRSRATALWLFLVAAVVLAMVVVGGATRLTGSGLSITEWKPVSGALPPMSSRAWDHLFTLYREIPQYRLVNRGMSLEQFKSIFWWEWGHRLLGRILGVTFAAPFVVLVFQRRAPRRLMLRLIGLFLLGGFQGAVGWWMVQSGLERRISVAPERLATHLCLALLLFSGLIWTGLEAWAGPRSGEGRRDGWTRVSLILLVAVFCQCLLGALVAGNQAGLLDNDWPMMAGSFFPPDYWRNDFWSTVVHGASAVQFNHRILAYGIVSLAVAIGISAVAARRLATGVRVLGAAVALVSLTQVILGISVLITLVSLPLALLHQVTAAILLATAVAFAWRARRGR